MFGKNSIAQSIFRAAAGFSICFVALSCARPNFREPGNPSPPITLEKPSCSLVFQNSKLCLRLSWPHPPRALQWETFQFEISSSQDTNFILPETSALRVSLFMPSMGHGSSKVYVKRLERNLFEATHVWFNMTGDWEVRFQLDSEQGEIDYASEKLFLD